MNSFNEAKIKAITGLDKTADMKERIAIVEDLDEKGLLIDFFMSEKEKNEFLLALERQKAKQYRKTESKHRAENGKIKSRLQYLNIFSKSE